MLGMEIGNFETLIIAVFIGAFLGAMFGSLFTWSILMRWALDDDEKQTKRATKQGGTSHAT